MDCGAWILDSAAPRGLEEADEKQHAANELRQYLVGIFVSGLPVTAKDLCIVSHYMLLSGGTGMEDFAMRPDRTSPSNFSQHVQLVSVGPRWRKRDRCDCDE